MSTNGHSQQVGVSETTMWRILTKDLNNAGTEAIGFNY